MILINPFNFFQYRSYFYHLEHLVAILNLKNLPQNKYLEKD